MTDLIIATWNIGGGHTTASTKQFDYNENEDAHYFSSQLQELKPDIICLQESHANDTDSLTARIATSLGIENVFETIYHPSHIDEQYHITGAILSKAPLAHTKQIPIAYPDFELKFEDGSLSRVKHQKFLQTCQIGPLLIANVHANNLKIFGHDYHKGNERLLAAKVEDTYLAELKGPLIFAADFNCENAAQLFPKLFKDRLLKDSLPDEPSRPDGERTDYMLYSPELEVVDAGIVRTKADHYLCWSKFRFD